MAQFGPAYRIIQKNEGGYLNDPRDHGGETYRGIARNFFPGWEGWKIIDKYSNPPRIIRTGTIINDPILEQQVRVFYHNLWNSKGMPSINNQDIANIFFDFIVLAKSAVAAMQQTLKEMGFAAIVDNKIGRQTISAINAADPVKLHDRFKKKRSEYHHNRVQRGLVSSKWLPGWLKRTAQFPSLSKKNIFLTVAVVLAVAAGYAALKTNNKHGNSH